MVRHGRTARVRGGCGDRRVGVKGGGERIEWGGGGGSERPRCGPELDARPSDGTDRPGVELFA